MDEYLWTMICDAKIFRRRNANEDLRTITCDTKICVDEDLGRYIDEYLRYEEMHRIIFAEMRKYNRYENLSIGTKNC